MGLSEWCIMILASLALSLDNADYLILSLPTVLANKQPASHVL